MNEGIIVMDHSIWRGHENDVDFRTGMHQR